MSRVSNLAFCSQLLALCWIVMLAGAVRAAPLQGDLLVHDPSTIIQCKDQYWLFATGKGIKSLHSADLINWQAGPRVFEEMPTWVTALVPDQKGHFWAPDVVQINGRYFLYYSISSFGKNTSAIALATNATLDPNDPAYRWEDWGIVIRSGKGNDFNAIDPAVTTGHDGRLWLTFGSFWSGIKLLELDSKTGLRTGSHLYSLARHGSIEAPFIYWHAGHYYLFVNWGLCCKGVDSTYEIRVGRSREITGPYLDAAGRNLRHDGGTLLLESEGAVIGPGHAGIFTDHGKEWLSYHYYNARNRGRGTLNVVPLRWTDDGWPVAGKPEP